MRAILNTFVAFGVGSAALSLSACGQGPGGSEVATSDNGADQALSAVDACQNQAQACRADGGAQACEDQLRSCLGAIMPGAGGPPQGHPEAGDNAPSSPPGLDGATPPRGDGDDGGASHGPTDGGSRPALPEAAVSALTSPVGNDAGSATLKCVDAMHACLATRAAPDSCADSFRTCVQSVVDTRRPDGAGPH
jgi:hypothetical protein